MNPKPPPPGKVLLGVLAAAVVFVASLVLVAKLSQSSLEATANALARLEAETGGGPVAAVDALVTTVFFLLVFASNGFLRLADLAVTMVSWLLRQLGYPATKPYVPRPPLWRGLVLPLAFWAVSILVGSLAP